MGFARTFIALCSGTEVFPRLIDVSPFKALFHLFMLILLSATFVTACRLIPLHSISAKACEELSASFGSLTVSRDSILPAKNAEARRAFIITKSFRLDYFPPGNISLKDMDEWKAATGIFWTRRGLLFWVSAKGEKGAAPKYMLLPLQLLASPASEPPPYSYQTKEALEAYLSKDFSQAPAAAEPPAKTESVELHFGAIGLLATLFAAGALFFGTFLGVLFLSATAILFFASAQYIWIAGASPRFKFKNMLVVIAYAAFPPVAIASLFPAFDLPFLGFQTAFFVTFFIYHILAFNRVQRHLNPPKASSPSTWNDDDDTF